MKTANAMSGIIVGCAVLVGVPGLWAQDWPQFRGPNRNGRVSGFTAPSAWPKELTQKWKVTVGDGVATPALVGDKLFVFSRQEGSEITRCLEAASGKELWQDKYESGAATGPAGRFPGPRASPTVADGKVVTLGVQGTLSCLEAATGKKLWRKDDFKGSFPRFFTSSSPIVVDGLCIAQLGSSSSGAIVAYDLASGEEKWKWSGDGTAYASPVLLTLGNARIVVAETEQNIVAIAAADGKLLWKTPFAAPRQGRNYNAATPMVEGQTVIYSGSGRGTKAVKIEKQGDEFTARELWSNTEVAVQFSTPVLKKGLLFGITGGDKLFCVSAETGKTAWTTAISAKGGYGTVVDAGPVLFALTPGAELIVFESSDKEFTQIAKYKLAGSSNTYAYPIVAGSRLYVKDHDSVALWTIE
jgi:outer membrane protein assembly factor BamB